MFVSSYCGVHTFSSRSICILGAKDALRILYKYGANQMHADKESLNGESEYPYR